VLEALGANINLEPERVARAIAEVGVGFMFAPNHHRAMKHAAPVRKELGVKTIFNILGPLTNPAGARQQVMGVFHPDLVGIQARVLQDEISISGPTAVGELKDDEIREYTVVPADFGLPVHDALAIRVASVEQSKAMLLAALGNEPGAPRDIVAVNAGASIYVAGLAETLGDGVKLAQSIIASGAARRRLDSFVAFTREA
jgi:anthranilate phosphoribosyltransferase